MASRQVTGDGPMPEGSRYHGEDSAGPTLGLFGIQQELALDFYAKAGPVRVEGTPERDLRPCPTECEPFPWVPPDFRSSLHLASVRLFRLGREARAQLRQVTD